MTRTTAHDSLVSMLKAWAHFGNVPSEFVTVQGWG